METYRTTKSEIENQIQRGSFEVVSETRSYKEIRFTETRTCAMLQPEESMKPSDLYLELFRLFHENGDYENSVDVVSEAAENEALNLILDYCDENEIYLSQL